MEITLATPSLLFPAISLLLLAYTNRFLGLASVVRALHAAHKAEPDDAYVRQIQNIRTRLKMIRTMQLFGVISILLCTVAMFCLFLGWVRAGEMVFGASLVFMIASLVISAWEIQISVRALDVQLQDIEGGGR
jgi:type IV secretory pathway VirB2 component (pilin)